MTGEPDFDQDGGKSVDPGMHRVRSIGSGVPVGSPLRRPRWRLRSSSFVAVLGLLSALLILAPRAARACSCAGDPFDPDAVFVGTVVGEEGFVPRSRWGRWAVWTFFRVSFEGHRYRVHASTSWLGLNHPNVIIFTGFGGGDCGAPLEIGKSYLFRTNRGPKG